MRISFLIMFLLTVILATPTLIRGFRELSVVGLSWIGTISACIIYSFLFGIPMSIQAVLIMLVASMFASGIAITMQLKTP